ncbi:MAG TPA: ABC transporter ATP-binding protein [Gemmatimonadales bacterium]
MTRPFVPHGIPRSRKSPLNPEAQPSLRARLGALKRLPPLFTLVFQTHRAYSVAIVVLRAARAVVPLSLLWIGKLIIDAVVAAIAAHRGDTAVDWWGLGVLVTIELVVAVVGEGLARASSLLESLLGDLFANRLSERMLAHAATLDLEHFEDSETYDRLERARRQTVGRIGLLALVLDSAQAVVTLVSLAGALVLYVPWLLLLLGLAVIPAFLGEARFAQLGYSLLFQWTPERRVLDYLRYVGASDLAVKEVKLFGLADYLQARYRTLADEFYDANRALAIRRSAAATVYAAISALGYYGAFAIIVYLTVIGYRSPGGLFTIGVLTFLAGSFRQSRDLIQRVLLALAHIYEQSLYLNDLFTFFELQPSIRSGPGALPVPRPIVRGIVFEHVGFRYPGADTWAVRHLDFAIPPGETVALVGENGAGKTTLVKLLARLYDPSEGRILLDGVDLKEYDLADVHAHIGVIFQDFVRYDFLLRENIGIGQVERIDDRDRIRSAAERGLADAVAARLTDGFDQQLGRRFDHGVDLSGGEWQKVALARAYMRDAQVLILDEPTAALDARAEYEVFLRFTELTHGRMAVIISHRFSTVRMAGRILVLRHGELIERGTHDDLVKAGGLYAELFGLQAAGYR